MTQKIFLSGLIAASLFSCKPAATNEPSVFENAKFLLNEGAFTGGTATITAFMHDTVIEQAFISQNALPLGNIGQHMIMEDSLLFVTINNGNQVRGISANTLKSKWQSTVASPRYMAMADGNLLVTNWGGNRLQILDAQTGSALDSIDIYGVSEAIHVDYPNAYVALNGGFGLDNRVAVVDLVTKAVDTLTVGDKPNSFAVSNNELYVLCEGYQDWSGGASSPGSLWKITATSAIEVLVASTAGDHAAALRSDGSMLYFLNATYNGALVQVDPNSATAWPSTTLSAAVGYNLDIINDTIYLHNAKDFASAGLVYLLDKQGTILDSLAAGVIPRQMIK